VIQEGSTDVLGTANLFLMNPNGIVFGAGARLDLGGSFVGTTANAIGFGDLGVFRANNLSIPSQLLTVNPSALLFDVPTNTGSILVQGDSQGTRTTAELIDTQTGLRVGSDRTLALLGGNITLEGATVKTAGGRIEIGSVAAPSTVSLNPEAKGWSLDYTGVENFGDVQLARQSTVDASGLGSGDIHVQARRVLLTGGSQLEASTLGNVSGGTLTVNASESVEISPLGTTEADTGVFSVVYLEATGAGGDLSIITGDLTLRDGGLISASNGGRGNSGVINIVAINSITLENGGLLVANNYGNGNSGVINIVAGNNIILNTGDNRSRILSNVLSGAEGNTGGIRIRTGSLFVNGGSQISSIVYGIGNSGGVSIRATDIVAFDGRDNIPSLVFPSALFTNMEGTGNGGNIEIHARLIRLTNRAQIAATLGGKGTAGSITLNATDHIFLLNSLIISEVTEQEGIGQGGKINITTGTLELRNGSALLSDTEYLGNAGNITINAQDAIILAGRGPSAFNLNLLLPSQISSTVDRVDDSENSLTGNSVGIGEAGAISITARSLSLTDEGFISTTSEGQGNAGLITIAVDDVRLASASRISSDIGQQAIGDAGDINISASSVSLADRSQISSDTSGKGSAGNLEIDARNVNVEGSQISSSTSGNGNAGSLSIRASDSVVLNGESPGANGGNGFPGGLFAQVNSTGVGDGGNLTLRTNQLSVSDGSKIQVATFGQGDAGDLFIDANTINVFDTERYNFYSTGIIADVAQDASVNNRPVGTGNGGNVTIETGRLSILGGHVTADTDGTGNAGTVRVHARDSIEIGRTSSSGLRGFLAADVNQGATGQGGSLIIETGDLIVRDGGRVSTDTYGRGNAGDLSITARNVNVEGSQISSSTFGRGDAGNLRIRASDSIVLSGENPGANGRNGSSGGLFAQVESTGVGEGGNLTLRTNHLSVSDGSKIQVATFGQGDAGDLFIRANTINVRETRRSNFFTTGIFAGIQIDPQSTNPPIGNGGRVAIRTDRLRINGGEISANTAGQGNAGRLSIRARDRIEIIGTSPEIGRDSLISTDVAPNATGRGGRISIETGQLNVRDGGRISARTEGQRRAGDIFVRSDDLSLLNGTISTATTSESRGRGGDITINAGNLELNDRSRITASTQGQGRSGNVSITSDNISVSDGGRILTSTSSSNRRSHAGDITIQNSEDVNLNGRRSRIFTGTESNTTANGGNVNLATDELNISDRARISAQSDGRGRAGDITINASGQTRLTDGNIITSATRSSGGDIQINGDAPITLEGNSRITTDSRGNGGNISLDAPGIVAFSTSDILARSRVERGGRIELAPFFGEGYQPDVPVEGDRININASGGVEDGEIQTPDTSFIQNSLANIPEDPINTDRLLANSCIVRDRQQGQFTITGSGGLPDRPGNPTTAYPTGAIAPIPSAPAAELSRPWQMGDAIQEPQGVYKLPDGRLVISRECSQQTQ